MTIQPLHDWLLVKMDKIPETQGPIVLVHGARIRSGTVLRTGSGWTNKFGNQVPMEVEPGERVAFFRENLEHSQGKAIVRILAEHGEDFGLLREADVLFAFTGELDAS